MSGGKHGGDSGSDAKMEIHHIDAHFTEGPDIKKKKKREAF